MRNTRKNRKIGLEMLESRELMAADASFNSKTGALVIHGTAAADQVLLTTINSKTLSVQVNSNVSLNVNPRAVKSIKIDLGAGSDQVTVDNIEPFSLTPKTVDISMGTGSNEVLNLWFPSVGTINVDAAASLGTVVNLKGVVTDKLSIDMGLDGASDTFVSNGAEINKLQLKMGGGSDDVVLLGSVVHNADINLGKGDDKLEVRGTTSVIESGIVNGDEGRGDGWDRKLNLKKTKISGFEVKL